MVTSEAVHDVLLEAVDPSLQCTGISPNGTDLMASHHRDRVRQFNAGDLIRESSMSAGRHVVRQRLDGLQRERGRRICGASGIAGIQAL